MAEEETVYLAGKITGDPHYREKFCTAAQELEAAGYVVINPAMLPDHGFTWEAYIRMSSAMLDECASVCFLPDWTESQGAKIEFCRAVDKGKRTFAYQSWLSKMKSEVKSIAGD